MKVSVIIPVYNSENYIEKCILSILNQTYYNYELIVVNDGSSDQSLNILNKLLSKKENVQIINQTNQGVSKARNTGIAHATGSYIAFIDSDDYIAPNYLERLINATCNGKMDWVLSGTSYIQEKKEVKVVSLNEDTWNQRELDCKYIYIDYTTSIHGKLYKKEILDKFHLHFDISMSFAEDRDFNIEFMKHIRLAHNIAYIGYTYCTDIPNSLSKKKYHYKFRNDCIYWNKVLSLKKNNHPFNVFVTDRFYHSIIDNIGLMVNWLGLKKTLQIIKNEYLKEYKIFINSNKEYIKAPIWQKTIIIKNPYIYCIIVYLINKLHE